eukprot:CAMPEP_0172500192 /NCGR_PEP_ID=MMETSP1066-20121228/135640_1 /TAXON_ID=671091 /ORGANISM="Coscinodiscus wailesii, Strain CCMP2513" /LENGTH=236 /DNA_ID=CAMNT_0013274305 /DNA_START=227 /DNA_END=937 /DNA_ORIENTATION=-
MAAPEKSIPKVVGGDVLEDNGTETTVVSVPRGDPHEVNGESSARPVELVSALTDVSTVTTTCSESTEGEPLKTRHGERKKTLLMIVIILALLNMMQSFKPIRFRQAHRSLEHATLLSKSAQRRMSLINLLSRTCPTNSISETMVANRPIYCYPKAPWHTLNPASSAAVNSTTKGFATPTLEEEPLSLVTPMFLKKRGRPQHAKDTDDRFNAGKNKLGSQFRKLLVSLRIRRNLSRL